MEATDKNKIQLKEEVSKVYEVAPGAVKEFVAPKLGKIDLNTVNLALAAKLEKLGVLVKKGESKELKTTK